MDLPFPEPASPTASNPGPPRAPDEAEPFRIPDGFTREQVRTAAGLLVNLVLPGGPPSTRITRRDFERCYGFGRSSATVRRDWERTKRLLEVLGAPVRRVRDARTVDLVLDAGATEFGHRVLDALLRTDPPPARRRREPPPTPSRAGQRAVRRAQARLLRAEGRSLRAIAKELGVSVGTVHSDLRSAPPRARDTTWADADPEQDDLWCCLLWAEEGACQVARDAKGPAARARAQALARLVLGISRRVRRLGRRKRRPQQAEWAEPQSALRERAKRVQERWA